MENNTSRKDGAIRFATVSAGYLLAKDDTVICVKDTSPSFTNTYFLRFSDVIVLFIDRKNISEIKNTWASQNENWEFVMAFPFGSSHERDDEIRFVFDEHGILRRLMKRLEKLSKGGFLRGFRKKRVWKQVIRYSRRYHSV